MYQRKRADSIMARLVKRGNSWQYEISYKKDDGKYTKIRKSGFKTKGEAKDAANELEYNLNKGLKGDRKIYYYQITLRIGCNFIKKEQYLLSLIENTKIR